MYHLVYLTTNLINGKYYVGVHSTYNINDGYLGSGKHLKRAIKKYGRDSFHRTVLHYCLNHTDAYDIEKYIVDEQFITNPHTYNIVSGGGSGDIQFRKNKTYEEIFGEERGKVLKLDRAKQLTNRPCSDETRRKMSEWQKGKIKPNSENIGRYERTDDIKTKLSERAKNRPTTICPYCDREINNSSFGRWHGDRCKLKPS